jgi:hypothetical protein
LPHAARDPSGAPGRPFARAARSNFHRNAGFAEGDALPGAAGRSIASATLGVGNATCPNGGSSFTGASGTTFACNGVATSFASVDAAGTLATSRGVTGVEPGTGTGVYCVKLASTPAVAVASVRGDATTPGSAQVRIPATGACTASGDTSAEVLTFNGSGAAAALPFNVMFG